jgi:hypothetical protein
MPKYSARFKVSYSVKVIFQKPKPIFSNPIPAK